MPAANARIANAAAMIMARVGDGLCPAPRKIVDVTTPAMIMQAIAPLLNGQKYNGSLSGKTSIFAVENTHSATSKTNHPAGAHFQRRVGMYRMAVAR